MARTILAQPSAANPQPTGSTMELLAALRWALLRIRASSLAEGEHFARAQAVADAAECAAQKGGVQ